jgi:mannose-1-phosphate guanylyltransferase
VVVAAMVLAAGMGSRLRPMTDVLPKPLVPVGDRPALAHVLERLAAAGLSRVVVNGHHGLEKLREFLAGHPAVALSVELELLGTAGGVAAAAALLGEGDVLIWNADILAAIDGAALVSAHAGPPDRAATLVVQGRAAGTGNIGLDRTGRIVRLRGERVADEASGGEFLGVHVIGEGLRRKLPRSGCLVGDVYIPAMRAGARLQAFESAAPFFEIGSVASYLAANLGWLASKRLAHWSAVDARLGPGVSLHGVVLGAGATVRGLGALERCVVWPGGSVEAPLKDAVVMPGRIVPVGPC